MTLLLGYNWKFLFSGGGGWGGWGVIDFWWGGNKTLVGGSLLGGIFLGREGVNKFSANGWGLPSFPPVGKTLLLITLNVISFMEKIFMPTLRKLLLHGGKVWFTNFTKQVLKVFSWQFVTASSQKGFLET